MFIRTVLLVALLISTVPVLAQPPASTPAPGRASRGDQPTPTPGGDQPRPARRGDQPAQTPRTVPEPAAVAPVARNAQPPAPRREGQPVNVKVEFTITDQQPGAAAVKKSVSVVVADSMSGAIRSSSDVAGVGNVPLNIDVDPMILADGKLRLRFNLQYDLPVPRDPNSDRTGKTTLKMNIHDSMSVILESGKALTVAQSADPVGDRQVTVEVKATVLR